ncbi:MAG: Gfo/Idh/MocA family oxidoreductase, partial [candidate division KSB1 bacterium]|nr:Gfo/Idh/MocA family oxidoreductase [candidate division KSB1 bacterium]
MLRGALIGVGNAAINGHVPAYLDDPWLRQKVKIVAAADPAAENLALLRERLPAVTACRAAEEIFAADGVDFIDICTPPNQHLEIVRMAAQRGCHVLCEKPLAASLTDGLEIHRLVRKRPLVFMPCHQYRFSPLWRAVQHLVRADEIGEVRLAQFEVFRLRADPGSGRWEPGWRTQPHIAGGGIIFDIGTHYFYLAFSLFGLPEQISARVARLAHSGYEVEDTALVILEYPTLLVQINLTWAAEHRENRVRLIGTKGDLELREDHVLLQRGGERREWLIAGASGKAAYPRWYGRLFREFIRKIETASYSTEYLAEAANTLRCAELCY